MQITETSADGLKREYKVVIPAQEIETQVNSRLQELSRTVRLPGFPPRQGAAADREAALCPVGHGRGAGARRQRQLPEGDRRARSSSGAAAQDPGHLVRRGGNLEYDLAVELLPDIEPVDFSTIELERVVAEVDDKQAMRRWTVLPRAAVTASLGRRERARNGDILVIDFAGTSMAKRSPAWMPRITGSSLAATASSAPSKSSLSGRSRAITAPSP